jgi:hypothetical protein
MTEQQEHLTNLLQQRQALQTELDQLQETTSGKRELFWKVQGAIEYLAQTGVTLPEPAPEEAVEEEPAEEFAEATA